ALALALAPRHDVFLWGRDAQTMREAGARRENAGYLPGFALPSTLALGSSLEQALAHLGPNGGSADGLLVLATSVAGLRPMLERLRGRALPGLVWLCKGFEEGTRLLPHQVVRQVLGEALPAGVLSGPSFAQEVARGLPCALTVASGDPSLSARV